MTSPRPLTLSIMNFCYPNFPTLASLLLLSPGFNHIFRIVVTSPVLLTLTLLLTTLPLVFPKALYLVPPSSLPSSTTFLPSFLQTLQFCLQMIPPSTLSVTVFSIQSSLQLCLDLANLWLQRNGLKINAGKTKSMLIHSRRKIVDGNTTLNIDDRSVECVQSFKFLGVIINNTLTWVDHISMVCKKVSCSLNLLRRLSWFLPRPFYFFFSNPTFFCTLITMMLFGSGAPSKKHTIWKPSSTSPAAQFYVGVMTIQLLLPTENWVCPLWHQGGNFILPTSIQVPHFELPPISPSFSLTLLLTTTLAPPHLLNLICLLFVPLWAKVFQFRTSGCPRSD